ncbi:hypothetical protein FOZ61_003271 [Perkinsus olseni]|uniref:Uncharacterized protein n=1 Tax=Perkinsus olseni TaxID=32597 RepID=A0A7J6MIN0_PEROL|nr:hypothetical protein FOZ61_003271 [Perkinsus olseni]
MQHQLAERYFPMNNDFTNKFTDLRPRCNPAIQFPLSCCPPLTGALLLLVSTSNEAPSRAPHPHLSPDGESDLLLGRSLHVIVERVVDAGDNIAVNFDLLVEATSNIQNEYLCQLPNSTELFAQAGYQFLEVDPSQGTEEVQVTACERTDTNGAGTVPPLPDQPQALAFGCSAFEATSSIAPNQLCMDEGRMAYDYFRSPVPAGFDSRCNCQQATRCKNGESWPVDKAGNTYPGRTAASAWWEATRDDEWKYETAVCTTTGCSCWLACTQEEYDPCNGEFRGDGQLTVNQVNQYLYDGYPLPPTHGGASASAESATKPQFRMRYRLSGYADVKAAVADANRIRKLAPGLGASVQRAFEAAANVALTAENSIELLEVDSPVSNDNDQSLLGIFTYVGILPSAFESCASNMAGSAFNGDNKNTNVAVENGANEVKVYTEVSAGGDREGSANRMETLITGSLLTSCASPASINPADIPMLESRQAPQPTTAPAKKNPALPWYAWLLIAIGIVLVIAACVYIWWILASRRKQRENRLKLSDEADGDGCCSERGLVPGIAPATGYVDDDADTATVTGIGSISTHARLPSSATHRASPVDVPTAVVSVNPDGSLTPRLPLAPKNPVAKSSSSLITTTPDTGGHRDSTRSHEAPY